MSTVTDLELLGVKIDDPVQTAMAINGLPLTTAQKRGLLSRYLAERGLLITPEIRVAARAYLLPV